MSTHYYFYPAKKKDGIFEFNGLKKANGKLFGIFCRSGSFVPYDFSGLREDYNGEKYLSEEFVKEFTYKCDWNDKGYEMSQYFVIKATDIFDKIKHGFITTAYMEKEAFRALKLSNHNNEESISYEILEIYYDSLIPVEEYAELSDEEKKNYIKYSWVDTDDDRFFWFKLWTVYEEFLDGMGQWGINDDDYLVVQIC